MASKRRSYDWDAIEQEYRAGQLSLRVLSKMYGPAASTIQERAKRHDWKRDLSEQVRQAINAELLDDASSGTGQDTNTVRSGERSDSDVIKGATERGVEIVRGHRTLIGKSRNILDALLEEVRKIAVEGADAASLPGLTQTMRQLTGTLKDVVSMERQAFNIDDEKGNGEQNVPLSERLANLRRKEAIQQSENVEELPKRRA